MCNLFYIYINPAKQIMNTKNKVEHIIIGKLNISNKIKACLSAILMNPII